MRIIWLVFILLAAPVLAQDPDPVEPNAGNTGTENEVTEDPIENINQSLVTIQKSIDSIAANTAPDDDAQKDQADRDIKSVSLAERDLNAQQKMAKYTRLIYKVTAWGLVIGFLTVIGLAITIFQTRKITRQDREMGEAQVRAYLSIEKLRCTIKREPRFEMKISISCKNTGQSPASNVEAVLGIRPVLMPDTVSLYETKTVPFEEIPAGATGKSRLLIIGDEKKIEEYGANLEKLSGFTINVVAFADDVFSKEITRAAYFFTKKTPVDNKKTKFESSKFPPPDNVIDVFRKSLIFRKKQTITIQNPPK